MTNHTEEQGNNKRKGKCVKEAHINIWGITGKEVELAKELATFNLNTLRDIENATPRRSSKKVMKRCR